MRPRLLTKKCLKKTNMLKFGLESTGCSKKQPDIVKSELELLWAELKDLKLRRDALSNLLVLRFTLLESKFRKNNTSHT